MRDIFVTDGCQCLSVVDNVMFIMLNEDKDSKTGTSQKNKSNKKTHEEAPET